MKKNMLALAILVAGASFATSIKVVDIRLQAVTTSVMDLHYLPVGKRPAIMITVDRRGEVVGAACSVEQGNPLLYSDYHNITVLDRLSNIEQQRIELLIALARKGEIQYPNPGGQHCLAMPTHSSLYNADNSKVFLEGGTYPCGGMTQNTSKAAVQLVKLLKKYEREYARIH